MEKKGSSARSKPTFLPGKGEEKNSLSFLLDAVLSQAEYVPHIWPQDTKAGLETEFTVTSDVFLSSYVGRICWGCKDGALGSLLCSAMEILDKSFWVCLY